MVGLVLAHEGANDNDDSSVAGCDMISISPEPRSVANRPPRSCGALASRMQRWHAVVHCASSTAREEIERLRTKP